VSMLTADSIDLMNNFGGNAHMNVKKYTKYEKARIIGARALQISMGAPILVDIPKDIIDPVKIALIELENDAIPMTVKRKKRSTV
jgi:DNA-directed RNA polymerase, subunit K/omega